MYTYGRAPYFLGVFRAFLNWRVVVLSLVVLFIFSLDILRGRDVLGRALRG